MNKKNSYFTECVIRDFGDHLRWIAAASVSSFDVDPLTCQRLVRCYLDRKNYLKSESKKMLPMVDWKAVSEYAQDA